MYYVCGRDSCGIVEIYIIINNNNNNNNFYILLLITIEHSTSRIWMFQYKIWWLWFDSIIAYPYET